MYRKSFESLSLCLVKICLTVITALVFVSCGSGGGGGSSTGGNSSSSNAPVLSNLIYSPDYALLNSGSGVLTITFSIDADDADGNMSTIDVTYRDSQGTELAAFSDALQGASGVTYGTINGTVFGDTTIPGSYTFEFCVTDEDGQQSNILSGTYNISVTPIQDGTPGDEIAHAITTDGNGNIYVTGSSTGDLHGNVNAGGGDIFLVKYNSSLTREWTRLLGTGPTAWDIGHGVAVDTAGNIYVTGITWGDLDGNISAGDSDLFLLKYDSSGTKQWTAQFGTSSREMANDVALDVNGDVYIAGNTGNAGNILLYKYSSSGVWQWTEEIVSSSSQTGEAIALDNNGNIYIVGSTYGSFDGNVNMGKDDLVIIKFDASGTKQWTKQLGTAESDYATDVATDAAGNIYVAGYSFGNFEGNIGMGGSPDMILMKFDSAGVMQWSRQTGTSAMDYANGVKVDADGNIYMSGIAWDNTMFVKYDANGTEQWKKQLSRTNTSYDTIANDLAIGVDGKIYVAGYTNYGVYGNTNAGGRDYYFLKFNSSGVLE